MYPDIEDQEFKEQLIAHFDETSLLDALGIDMEQLVDLLVDQIDDNRDKLTYMLQC